MVSSFWERHNNWIEELDKEADIRVRRLKPQAGDWVQFSSEYGDVWHKVIRVHEPEDYYATIYYWNVKETYCSNDLFRDGQANRLYHYVRTVTKELPEDARMIFDENHTINKYTGVTTVNKEVN